MENKGFTYDSLKHGDKIECEDFWHSDVLTWEIGTVQVWESGEKIFLNDRHKMVGHKILPHRMQNYRRIQDTRTADTLIK